MSVPGWLAGWVGAGESKKGGRAWTFWGVSCSICRVRYHRCPLKTCLPFLEGFRVSWSSPLWLFHKEEGMSQTAPRTSAFIGRESLRPLDTLGPPQPSWLCSMSRWTSDTGKSHRASQGLGSRAQPLEQGAQALQSTCWLQARSRGLGHPYSLPGSLRCWVPQVMESPAGVLHSPAGSVARHAGA